MRFAEIRGFCIRLDRQVEFQRWLAANEERMRASYPPGVEYGGTYVAVFTSDRNGGDYYTIDFLDSYGAMDRAAAITKDETSDWAKLGQEFMEFIDPSRSAGWSHRLLKSVVDASIMDAPTA
jgi:hypothetical protein